MKAYCFFNDFNKDAIKLIESMNIYLTIHPTNDRPDKEELIDKIKEYDIIIIGAFAKITSDMLDYIKTPKIIATVSVGLDHIDKVFFSSSLVEVVNIKNGNAISVAEHIFSLILSLNKRLVESNILALEGESTIKNIHQNPIDISGKTLGLIGCGNITKEVIKIANVFNMNIKCYTKNPNNHKDVIGVAFCELDEVLKSSDIINISIPLNEETKNLISKEKISLMKKTATFINTSREGVVDTKALIDYADLYDTFYVGLDISLKKYKDLFKKYRNNVIVTPHIAGITDEAKVRMDMEVAENIIKVIEAKRV